MYSAIPFSPEIAAPEDMGQGKRQRICLRLCGQCYSPGNMLCIRYEK